MAVRGVITEFFSLEEFERQKKVATDGVKEYIELANKAQPIRVELKGADKIKTIVEGAKELSASNIRVSETTTKVITTQRELDKAIVEGRVQKQAYNKELKTEVELENALTGSIARAKAEVKALTAERDKLNLSTAEGKQRQIELNTLIDKNTDFIKENSAAMEKQRLNVGNYANSLADGFEKVRAEIEKLKQKQEGLQKLQKVDPIGFKLTAQQKDLDKTTASLDKLQDVLAIGSNENLTYSQSVRKIGFAWQDMEASGNFSKEFLEEFKKFAAQAKDSAEDLRQEIKALSSDTRELDLVASGLNTLVNAGQAVFATYELLGEGGEDVQKSIQRLIAVQQIANGVQQTAKDLTDQGSAAYTAYAGVQKIVKTTLDSNAAATVRLAAATKLLLGGLVIGGLAFLVIKMIQLKNAVSDAARQSKILAEVNKEVANSAGQEIAKLEVLYKVATNTNLSIKERKKAVDELQEQYPEHFKNINDEIILQGKAAKAYDATRAAILETAKTRAIESKLSELATSDLEVQLGRQDLLLKKADAQQQIRLNKQKADANKAKGFGSGVTPEEILAGGVALDSINRQLEEGNRKLEQNKKDRDFLLNQITTGSTGSSGGGGGSGNTRNTALLNILKREQERIAENNREIFEDENKTFVQRLEALRAYTEAKEEIIDIEKQIQLSKEKLTNDEIADINDDAADKRLKLEKETQAASDKIRFDQRISKEEKAAEEELKIYDNLYKDLSERYRKYLEEKEKKRKEDEDAEKETAKKRADLEKQLVSELTTLGFTVITASIERRKNQLQEEVDAIDEKKAKDIEVANQTITNEKDKAAAIAVIEARATAQKEQIQRKQQELDVKKAQFDKAQAIARIIQETAIAVVASLTKPALIPLIIGIGAAQLAAVIAQPIPKYKSGAGVNGRPEHGGGLAIVGDGGKKELVVTPQGSAFVTPDTSTLVNIPANSKVFPDADKVSDLMLKVAMRRTIAGATTSDSRKENTEVAKAIDKMEKGVVAAIKRIPMPIIHAENVLKTRIRNNGSNDTYLNQNLQG
jgi:hypothetical protein